MPTQLLFNIDERSQVGNARRAATELAIAQGFDATMTGKVGLAVTESGSNIVKHAGTGKLLLRPLEQEGKSGIEVMALDKGPGIANVGASLRDGHSTAGSLGSGLGALARLAHGFEIFTQPGRGTALRLELWAGGVGPPAPRLQFGGVCLAKNGELVCGDNWAVHTHRDEATVLVADGLGHGIEAGEAARAAIETLRRLPQAEPHALIEASHAALQRTRGAAVAVGRVGASAERGSYAAVGNITCRVEAATASRSLVSYNGTVGHVIHKVQEFSFSWPHGSLLILHSDGLGTHWSLDAYPGLASRHPALIAGVLYRDYDRGRDDVSVVVLCNRGPGQSE